MEQFIKTYFGFIAQTTEYKTTVSSNHASVFSRKWLVLEGEKELHVNADVDKSYSNSYTVLQSHFLSNTIAVAKAIYMKAKTTLHVRYKC